MTEAEIIAEILRREGGFVNHPADRGGPTNWGITQATLSSYLGRPCSVDDVRRLDKETAVAIYRQRYVAPFDFVPAGPLRVLLIDAGVNHGVNRAIGWLQAAVGVNADGIVGPVTRDAVTRQPSAEVYRRVLRRRIIFYGDIITRDPKQAAFAGGWARRVAEFV